MGHTKKKRSLQCSSESPYFFLFSIFYIFSIFLFSYFLFFPITYFLSISFFSYSFSPYSFPFHSRFFTKSVILRLLLPPFSVFKTTISYSISQIRERVQKRLLILLNFKFNFENLYIQKGRGLGWPFEIRNM